DQSMMPEVRDLSDALPDLPMDPITGVGVVASRNRAPTGYDVVSRAVQFLLLMLWLCSNFEKKGRCYFFGSVHKNCLHLHLPAWFLVDLRSPPMFQCVTTPHSLKGEALRYIFLSASRVLYDGCTAAEAASCRGGLAGSGGSLPAPRGALGKLETGCCQGQGGPGPGVWPSAAGGQRERSWEAEILPREEGEALVPWQSSRPAGNVTCLPVLSLSAMDGVPFMISEKFACAPEGMQSVDLLGITIKTLAEIEKEYDYSFRTEQSAAARLPPSPTRCPPVPQS
ncbi:MB12B protein, partial [Heliornis fulica]|nr:MB12B protein [Heliornis fulica]